MKKYLTLTFGLLAMQALLTAFSLTATAFADNLFLDAHVHDCEYVGRSCYANGKDGFVTLWDAPGGNDVDAQFENGEYLQVGYTYHQEWAFVSWQSGCDIRSGWVPLADLYPRYDNISFEEEHGDQFRDYNGEFADYDGKAGDVFWFWEYPDACYPSPRQTEITDEMLAALLGTSDEVPCCISKVYVDELRHETWGYVEWLYGYQNFWIQLDNPTCDGIMICATEPDALIYSGEIIAPQKPVMPEEMPEVSVSYTPYILVAAVVVASACLLWIFWKKKK